MHKLIRSATMAMALVAVLAATGLALEGTVIDDRVHVVSLEGNSPGDDPERDVTVYLPPGYYGSAARYPVIYLLHAYSERHLMYRPFLPTYDAALQSDELAPAILVMPDGHNSQGGCWFTNSPSTGNWEDFIAVDLVEYVDRTYRTISEPHSRGIAGQSMGGFGAIRVAMNRPDVFGAAYSLDGPMDLRDDNMLQGTSTLAQSFAAALATPEVLYPNYEQKAARCPLGMLPELADNVAQLRGLGLLAGEKDAVVLANARSFSAALDELGLDHQFLVHPGGHSDNFEESIEEIILPFLAQSLQFDVQESASQLVSFGPAAVRGTPGVATDLSVHVELDAADQGPAPEGLSVDLSALGQATSAPLLDAGGGLFQARVAIVPSRPGRCDLPVIARSSDGVTRILWNIAVEVWPAADQQVLGEGLADGWDIDLYRAEVVDLAQGGVRRNGESAAHLQVSGGFAGWKVTLAPGTPVSTYGFTTLRLALRPAVPDPGNRPSLRLTAAPGDRLDLLAAGDLDLTRDAWQVVEIPLADLNLMGPITSLLLEGNFAGELYLDDVGLVAGTPPVPTAVSDAADLVLPNTVSLAPNLPNPFNSQTTISYALPAAGRVDLAVLNVLGQRLVTLVQQQHTAGAHTASWDGRDSQGRRMASGVYLYSLRSGQQVQTRRLLLLK